MPRARRAPCNRRGEAVVLSFPDQSEEQQQALYEDALRVYQIENTACAFVRRSPTSSMTTRRC